MEGKKKKERNRTYSGKKSHQATPRKCLMYRNNQSRRARNGNDENREKIETRSDRLFQPFSCFNFPPKIEILRKRLFSPLFRSTFHRFDSSDTLSTELSPKRERARDSNSSPRKKCFRKAQEKEREKLSGTQS